MKKWFGKKKLNEQLRIFFSIMITGLMMLMLGIFTFSTIRSSYVESEKQAGSQLDFMDSSYRTWLKSVNDLIVSVEMENAVQKFCRFQATDGIIYQELYSDLAGKLDSYLYVNVDVNFIVVVSGATGKYVFSGNQSMAATKFEQIYEENYAASQKAKVNGTLSIKYGNEYYIKEKHTVTFYQPIYSVTELDEQIGVICMNLNDSMLMDMNDSGNIELCMTDMEGNVLSSTDNELLNISGGLLDFHGQAEGMMNKVGKRYFFKRIQGWNFYVVSIVPLRELYRSNMRVAVLVIIITMSLLAVSLIIMRRMINKSYVPLQKVVAAMDKVSENRLDFRIETADMGEDFKKLGVGYNGMMDDIQQLMAEVVEEQRQTDQIRLNALQSQIQPHFLYNTLDCIHWQACADGNKETSELVMALARYYRICLSKGKDVIPLKQELEHIRCYLVIQNKRYGDIVQYDILVDDALADVKIPKLTLQPLVENAIYHGIRIKEGLSGAVRVEAEQQEGKVLLQVIDSGKGMSKEQIEEMNNSISNYDEEFGYGVRNVNRRIELTFGNEYGLYYRINEAGGVTVEILLPETYEKEADLIFGGRGHV